MYDLSLPINISVVRDDTGEICGHAESSLRDAHLQRGNAPEGVDTYVVEGHIDGEIFYYPDAVKTERPQLFDQTGFSIKADGEESVVLEIPDDCEVSYIYDGVTRLNRVGRIRERARVEDGIIEFATTKPGLYEFDLKPQFPLKRQLIRITAHD